jgi:hypothetical protein
VNRGGRGGLLTGEGGLQGYVKLCEEGFVDNGLKPVVYIQVHSVNHCQTPHLKGYSCMGVCGKYGFKSTNLPMDLNL